eukprot:Skav236587  [mRNA]  locus=scaffold529:103712:107679:+ [translate_table: standard]
MQILCSGHFWSIKAFSTQSSRKALGCFALEEACSFVGLPGYQVNAWDLSETFGDGVQWDLIAWNHPHLGTEDFRLHQFLLAHFFASVAKHLRPNGRVVLTLLEGQALRQHKVAAHSDESRGQTSSGRGARGPSLRSQDAGGYSYRNCEICGMSLPFGMSMAAHLEALKPLVDLPYACVCGRSFVEQRAVEQHKRFCKAPGAACDSHQGFFRCLSCLHAQFFAPGVSRERKYSWHSFDIPEH